jgi:hypothetical protein
MNATTAKRVVPVAMICAVAVGGLAWGWTVEGLDFECGDLFPPPFVMVTHRDHKFDDLRYSQTIFVWGGELPKKGLPEWFEREREQRERDWLLHSPKGQTFTVTRALYRYARDHYGRPPAHAAALVAEGYLEPSSLIATDSATDPIRILVGRSTTLARLPSLPAAEQERAVQEAAEVLPEGTVAHRLGDFVFTYHGMVFEKEPKTSLPIVMLAPAPEFNRRPKVSRGVVIGHLRSLFVLHAGSGSNRWRARERREAGLPPLPDPFTVRHDRPAVVDQALVP